MKKKISSTMVLFWSFALVLLSSISTTIFSETAFNDNFAFTTMGIAIVGLFFTASTLLVNTVLSICNPN